MRPDFKCKRNGRRPCLESLRLPIQRPALLRSNAKSATHTCYTQCAINPAVCNCLKDQCSAHFCNSPDDCMRSYSSSGSENENNIHDEYLNEINDEADEINVKNDVRLDHEINSEQDVRDIRLGRRPALAPLDRTPHSTHSITHDEYDNVFRQQANQTSSQLQLISNDVDDLKSTENNKTPISNSIPFQFRNEDSIRANTSDNTGVSEPEPAEDNRTANIKSSGVNVNTSSNVRPADEAADDTIHHNGGGGGTTNGGVTCDEDLHEISRYKFLQTLNHDYDISTQPKIQNSPSPIHQYTTTIPRYDNNKSFDNDSLNKDLHAADDVSNQCCLPSYIQAKDTADIQRDVNHIRNSTNPHKQKPNLTEYNLSDREEHQENYTKQSKFKTAAETQNEQNINHNNTSDDKFDESVHSDKRNVSKYTQTTNTYQEPSINQSENNQSKYTRYINPTLQDSSTTPESFNSDNPNICSREDFRNCNRSLCQNRSKLLKIRNIQFSNSNHKIDFHKSSSGLSKQGSSCCHENRGIQTTKKKESRYMKRKISFEKIANVECACSKKNGKSWWNYETDVFKKKTCPIQVGSSTCSSVSCIMNQNSGCPCRYPPSYQHLNCVGNIIGNCSCKNNNQK